MHLIALSFYFHCTIPHCTFLYFTVTLRLSLRGHGGVVITWRKSFQNISKLDTSPSHRVIGIKLLSDPRPLCILSVYLPSRSGCTDVFRESLDCLDSLENTLGYDNDIIILDDFNADLGPAGGPNCSTPSK